jgi:uncharacterized membrane protein
LCGTVASPDNGDTEKAMFNNDQHGYLYRTVAVVAGLAIIGFGVAPLLHGGSGDLFAMNWFGELVFAPLAIIFGLILIAFSLFKPEWLSAKRIERKRRN